MIQNTTQAKAGGIPRLAMINSFAGFGRISTTVSLPVISVLQVQVCPVPTTVLSNHLDFPSCYLQDYTAHMSEHLHVWEQLNLNFDGLYCGFLGSVEQIAIVKEFLDSPIMKDHNAHPIFLLDPVMGDNGKAYSTITAEHCNKMKELAAIADILTPNITEACLLTDTPYREDSWTDSELAQICHKLANLGEVGSSKQIVITGIKSHNRFLNYIWENGSPSTYCTEITGAARHGTGDMFASILAADALHQVPFASSVKKAADFIALCIQGSEEARLPVSEGVIFEKYLNRLLPNN